MKPIVLSLAVLASLSLAAPIPYDPAVGLKSMYYAGAAYCLLDDLQTNWNCGEPCAQTNGVKEFTPIINTNLNTFGYVAYNEQDNEIVVVFRGTQMTNVMNWVSDLDIHTVQYKTLNGSLVHKGFYSTYQFVSADVLAAVNHYLTEHEDASVLVTGHSLGAALATHAAMDIKENISPKKMTFYSYGSPRIGNSVIADYVMMLFPDGQYQRVTHYTDMAVHVPFTAMNYKHAGNEVWYINKGADMTFVECTNEPFKDENGSCANSYLPGVIGDDSHIIYVGHLLPGMCTRNAPESIFGSFTFLA